MKTMGNYKIAVAGVGYVGLSVSILLAQSIKVVAVGVNQEKIDMINNKISPLDDEYIKKYLLEKELDLVATTNSLEAYRDADFVIVATPTNYDPKSNYFDTSKVESVIEEVVKINPNTTIVIKSTIPVGFTKTMRRVFNENIIFSPEFLRESLALYDNLYPSRIVVSADCSNVMHKAKSEEFAQLLKQGAKKDDVDICIMGHNEAEAVKLFSNTYLAMRVAFFNELDTYAEMHNLKTKDIIKAMGYDERIGNYYNNPSFGYGGY